MVPGEAVDEVITRSLVVSSLSPDGASGFAAYHDGEKLPGHVTLSALRVTGRSLLTPVWQQQGRGPPLVSTSPAAAARVVALAVVPRPSAFRSASCRLRGSGCRRAVLEDS
ncbi:hypothetical protein DIPPA_08654 [Diplonema papillatum]|nr:hypothetical protein DIPPA_08654 [Diplonema papillatum]